MNPYRIFLSSLFAVLPLCFTGCSSDEEVDLKDYLEEGEQFSGGETTVYDESVNAFGHAAPNLTGNKDMEFVTGNAFFKRNWVTAPSSTEDLDGLGPLFVARSCSSCHALDGRGSPPLTPDEKPVALLFRLSKPGNVSWEPLPDDHYGDQFDVNAILGVLPEGDVRISYEEIPGAYSDGTTFSLRKPAYNFENLNYGPFASGIMISPRVATHLVGLGLLEAIEEQTLLDFADPNDADNDGISGKINYVWNKEKQAKTVGRFGWKANQPSVRQQVAAAFRGDMGLTSQLFPEQPCTSAEKDCNDAMSGGEPEISEEILDRVALYSASLAVPRRRDWDKPAVLEGKMLFNELGCESCHKSKIITGTHPDFPEFSNQTIRPYTDLLVHDMGDGLADNRPDGEANGNEWRTPPLWGIGLIKTVSGHTFLLHDGRARNIEEAILWHGGEAEKSREKFKNLSKVERETLIEFIESL